MLEVDFGIHFHKGEERFVPKLIASDTESTVEPSIGGER
jgi:hypothetical protein